MSLIPKQNAFCALLARLIQKIQASGLQCTMGEVYRPPFVAEIYAERKEGVANSVHTLRLAADINLFKDGSPLLEKKDFEPFGIWWESQSTADYKCCWGGRFAMLDSDHFSIENNGIR